MNPEQENKEGLKNEQQQIINNTGAIPASVNEDNGPDIKSEENKPNWKTYRGKMEAQRKAQQEAERKANERALEVDALKAALEASVSRPSNYNNNSYPSDGIEESEEARIDRRVEAKIRERESHYEKERLEREKKEAPNKILQIYPDFNQIVSTENCDYLDYHHPELTAPYKYMPEGIEKWDLMYKMIRKMIPQANSKKDEAKADKNLQKPGSVSSIGTTQGTGAMPSAKLDQARKDENYARMMRTIKGVS